MMKKLNLGITTDESGASSVHLSATFESKAAAIDFHADASALCRKASLLKKPSDKEVYVPMSSRIGWPTLRLKSFAKT